MILPDKGHKLPLKGPVKEPTDASSTDFNTFADISTGLTQQVIYLCRDLARTRPTCLLDR